MFFWNSQQPKRNTEKPSLLDRYTMAALTGICANPRVKGMPIEEIAAKAQQIACATLERRPQ